MQESKINMNFIKNTGFALLTFLLIFFLLAGFALLLASQLTNIFGWIFLLLAIVIMEYMHKTSDETNQ